MPKENVVSRNHASLSAGLDDCYLIQCTQFSRTGARLRERERTTEVNMGYPNDIAESPVQAVSLPEDALLFSDNASVTSPSHVYSLLPSPPGFPTPSGSLDTAATSLGCLLSPCLHPVPEGQSQYQGKGACIQQGCCSAAAREPYSQAEPEPGNTSVNWTLQDSSLPRLDLLQPKTTTPYQSCRGQPHHTAGINAFCMTCSCSQKIDSVPRCHHISPPIASKTVHRYLASNPYLVSATQCVACSGVNHLEGGTVACAGHSRYCDGTAGIIACRNHVHGHYHGSVPIFERFACCPQAHLDVNFGQQSACTVSPHLPHHARRHVNCPCGASTDTYL